MNIQVSQPPRSAQDIVDGGGLPRIYLIGIEASSRIFEVDRCPALVVDWIAVHCPQGITIERVQALKDCAPVSALLTVPEQLYYIAFDDLQADQFLRDFSEPPLRSQCDPNDIVLVMLDSSFISYPR